MQAASLLDAGASVNAKNEWGETPLHVSSIKKSLELVNLLIEKGADVNQKTAGQYEGHDKIVARTPLMWHVVNCDPPTIKVLLDAGPFAPAAWQARVACISEIARHSMRTREDVPPILQEPTLVFWMRREEARSRQLGR